MIVVMAPKVEKTEINTYSAVCRLPRRHHISAVGGVQGGLYYSWILLWRTLDHWFWCRSCRCGLVTGGDQDNGFGLFGDNKTRVNMDRIGVRGGGGDDRLWVEH